MHARSFARLLAALVILLMGGSGARAELALDKMFGEVKGWKIGFSESLSGCLAAATFTDKTTVWFGFEGDDNEAYIAFTNPAWRSVQPKGRYDLRIRTDRGLWNGSFIGFEIGDTKGIYAAGLKSRFVEQFALSSGIIVYLKGQVLTKPSLYGSRDALVEVMSCHKRYAAAAGGERPSKEAGRGGDKEREGGSSGTGFFVSPSGHVLTNSHVVENCRKIEVGLVGQPPKAAELVARDKTNDLALLRSYFTAPVAPALRPQIRLGESVFVFGFPLSDLLSSSGNFTLGSVTAVTGLGDDTRFMQISAPVQPGNSGGPLLDKYGNVAGVIVAKLNALSVAAATRDIPQNVNFAIKSSIAANFLASNDVRPSDSPKTRELPPEAIAELARTFTVKVTCN